MRENVNHILPSLMTMEYVRVRKDTLKDIKKLLEKQDKPEWHMIIAIFGMVFAVAIAGLVLLL